MTRTVFNESNTGHITKTYPMFFGDSLGLVDTVNVVNKEIEMLKEKQRGGVGILQRLVYLKISKIWL